ncbi:GNAT family N-acetyltransferase [Vibrio sp. SCSIO 43136]|uniref:GNAT family N-acetyltransferase n=1 Tax=Vibrio sp. SCSIO 43136 TaxID=2819101 RepID=UPI002074C94E|nr:GNAT family N-acetyltransferase [Vibrio sp. SCSIO 43136]USD64042.1 GNAT family N-acetyltransferase [Vibrio sp. SCSIO 43136]
MVMIRQMGIDDTDGVHRVSQYLGYSPRSMDQTRASIETILASPTDVAFVAIKDQQVVGWIHCVTAQRLASASFCEIVGLVVAPTQRNCGVGKALVNHAMNDQPGVWRVRCNEARTQSHQFYQALNFTQSKTQCVFEIQYKET